MLFRLIRTDQKPIFQQFMKCRASDLNLKEKDLENWIAENPELLFGVEQVLVITQSIGGQRMADIMALDADGRLVIVEIKRDWSNRETVGQLLEYAAARVGSNYEDLEELHRKYWHRYHKNAPYVSLIEQFRDLTDDPKADQKDIPKSRQGHRVCIVAPSSDEGLSRIVEWLKEYGVPISFVPFTLYTDTDNGEILLEIEPLPEPLPEGHATYKNVMEDRDRLFNTNEKNAPGAYKKMFEHGVIAIYGYETGPQNLMGSVKGQRVFAYVNGKGILAVGKIVNSEPKAVAGDTDTDTVFGVDEEFQVKVNWETIVADDKGVTVEQVKKQHGYRLPVLNVFCNMYCPSDVTNWIFEELQRRAVK